MNRNNTTMTSRMNTRPKSRREGNATRVQPGQEGPEEGWRKDEPGEIG
jgi:hypothetical protein